LGVYLHCDEERISRDTYESRTKDTTGANCAEGGTQHVSDLRGAASRRCSCVPERGFQVPSALFFKTEASNGAVAKQFSFSYSPELRISGFLTTQMEALNRHRGKVGQPMVVGNVNVNEGGQAIVGPVSHDGRGKASPKDAPDKAG